MEVAFPNYTGMVPSMSMENWLSTPDFKYSLNDGYNELAQDILNWIFPHYKDFSGYRMNGSDLLDLSSIEENNVVWKNSGPVGYVAAATLMALIMLVVGIAFCTFTFCCCCLRSRKYGNGDDSAYVREKLARISCTVGLGVWILLFSFGLFGCFVANEQLRSTNNDLAKELDNALADTQLYIGVTQRQIQAIYIDGYDEFSKAVKTSIGEPPTNEMDEFVIKAEEALNSLADDFKSGETQLEQRKAGIGLMSQICGTEACKAVESALPELDISNSHQRLKMILSGEVSKAVEELMLSRIQKAGYPGWSEVLDKNGVDIKDEAVAMIDALDQVPIQKSRDEIGDIENGMEIAVTAIYWTLLACCLVLFFIPIFLIVGVLLGTFGSNGSRQLLSKNTGGSVMTCALFTMFTTAWILWFLSIGGFLFSGLLTQVICEAIRDLEVVNDTQPENPWSTPMPVTEKPELGPYVLPTYPEIVQACKRDEGAFQTFRLEQVFEASRFSNVTAWFPPPTTTPSQIKLQGIAQKLRDAMDGLQIKPFMNIPSVLSPVDKGWNKLPEDIRGELDYLSTTETSYRQLIASHLEGLSWSLDNILKGMGNGIQEELGGPFEQIERYEAFVNNQTYYGLGECKPLWTALDSTITLFCYKIAAPIGAYWMSLTICLILFIPMIVTTFLLRRLYTARVYTV